MFQSHTTDIAINVTENPTNEAYAIITHENVALLSRTTDAIIKESKVYVKLSTLLNDIISMDIIDLVTFEESPERYTVWFNTRSIALDTISTIEDILPRAYTCTKVGMYSKFDNEGNPCDALFAIFESIVD